MLRYGASELNEPCIELNSHLTKMTFIRTNYNRNLASMYYPWLTQGISSFALFLSHKPIHSSTQKYWKAWSKQRRNVSTLSSASSRHCLTFQHFAFLHMSAQQSDIGFDWSLGTQNASLNSYLLSSVVLKMSSRFFQHLIWNMFCGSLEPEAQL